MKFLLQILISLIAIEHLGFLWLEMFAWETKGKKIFRNTLAADMFNPTKGLAANQGLYNGFLSAGLIWTLFISDNIWKINISIFFLYCVMVAGVYGAFTITKKIFFVQALPAIIALILILVL
jgi:putative membrane protein